MKKIVKYHLCWSYSQNDISSDVNNYIEYGYQPYGEPYAIVKQPDNSTIYCQAMVKYEN